jgi:Fe-S-cluster containining protein
MSEHGKPSLFEALFNEPRPKCCSHGDCCKAASPSIPVKELWAKAREGEAFAQGFLSIMQPYPSHEAARAVVGSLVERTLAAAAKSEHFSSPEEVVFYHCRYLGEQNQCTIYEDRPQFCRDYPDTPFVVMADGCAFESWRSVCKSKYNDLQDQVGLIGQLQQERMRLKQSATPHGTTVVSPQLEAFLRQNIIKRGVEAWLQQSLLGMSPLLQGWFVPA